MPGIQIGQIVMFVLDAAFGANCGEVRPAMVVRTWSGSCVQLCVFVDGFNDVEQPPIIDALAPVSAAPCTVWRTSVCEDADKKPGTYHR